MQSNDTELMANQIHGEQFLDKFKLKQEEPEVLGDNC